MGKGLNALLVAGMTLLPASATAEKPPQQQERVVRDYTKMNLSLIHI